MMKHFGWVFLIAFFGFAAWIRSTNMIYINPNLFIILWLVASFIVVAGVVFFRASKHAGDAGTESAER